MYWTDVNDTRGFHIFDTETKEHTPVDNPYRMFYNIYYEDTNYKLFDTSQYENKIVKVIVRKKTSVKDFEKFIDKLYSSNVAELKIVENFQVDFDEKCEDFESEDTITMLNRYINEFESDLNKSEIYEIVSSTYKEVPANLSKMYILVTSTDEEEGAFSVNDEDGNKVLYIFQEEDDATRYGMMLEDEDYPDMSVLEIDEDIIMQVCEINDYKYTVITPNDIIIPPKQGTFT